MINNAARTALGGLMAAVLGLSVLGDAANAQQRTVNGERYEPTVWIDPDGCEHWAMDDGAEGFMTPHRNRDGSPVCRRSEICGVIPTDQLFVTDEHWISDANKNRLMDFFNQTNAFGYIIYGHTDSRASDEYNMALSDRRANMVASVASQTGARIVDVKGFGERQPRATNGTAEGMQQNRRVEIYCLR
ncbi:OmpA family protein [Aestuariibius sp. HNIBRBA575]|uniref:OmpA family protein n=1 Tax=Aestuariibius sp. HNIBRBA575 TaxID=3233343 RepID=UPI0034A389C6